MHFAFMFALKGGNLKGLNNKATKEGIMFLDIFTGGEISIQSIVDPKLNLFIPLSLSVKLSFVLSFNTKQNYFCMNDVDNCRI